MAPNHDPGAGVDGVANKDDAENDGAEVGVLKREKPLPDEEDEVAAEGCGAVNVP